MPVYLTGPEGSKTVTWRMTLFNRSTNAGNEMTAYYPFRMYSKRLGWNLVPDF